MSGEVVIFSSNKSFLLRKSITDVSTNHLLLTIDSNNFKLSSIRFCGKIEQSALVTMSLAIKNCCYMARACQDIKGAVIG